ncbi:MAG: 50S ribosomal protein L10 [Candidatus Buchananbacteria bacterium]
MPKSRVQKKDILTGLGDKIQQAKAVVFVSFKGLKVKESEELRKLCRQEKVEFFVAKKTLIDLALKEQGLEKVSAKDLPGEVAAVFGYEDSIAPAKLLTRFSKDHQTVKLLAGIFEGEKIDALALKQLANLPSRPELLAKLVGTIKAPISGLVGVLHGNLRNIVQVLNAIKEQKGT